MISYRPIKWQNWITGDTSIPKEWPAAKRYRATVLRRRIARAARDCKEVWHFNSFCRTYAEQVALYAASLNGTGNLAAKPGTSNHEKGKAADVSVGGSPVGASSKRRRACQNYKLGFPVKGEAWHVEIVA